MDKGWILIGMMGAGKTSLGREISAQTGRQHFDTDHMLQQRLGRPIPQLFKIYGEATFRDHETSILKSIDAGLIVLSTGGGIVLREKNWPELHRLGIIIYVKVHVDDLTARLTASKKKRPLLQVDNWEERVAEILIERQSLYEQADITVDITGMDVETAAALVIERISNQS